MNDPGCSLTIEEVPDIKLEISVLSKPFAIFRSRCSQECTV